VKLLPERHRLVIVGYFLEGRKSQDLAQLLGVTESRISQLRAEALVLLRDGLNNHLDPDLLGGLGGGGCVARRREAYYANIAAQGDLTARLSVTSPLGVPRNF